jgi:putative sigma-54 modulation protein
VDIRIKGINMQVSPTIKDYVSEKIEKLDKYLENQVMSAEAKLEQEKNPSITNKEVIEVTLFTKGPIIRAKEASTDMHASVDGVIGKLERQISRYKEKMYRSSPSHRAENHKLKEEAQMNVESEATIVKRKQIPFKPMTASEATLQMDLLGHEFFVFKNSESDEINVVYKRHDENYGLIEPL